MIVFRRPLLQAALVCAVAALPFSAFSAESQKTVSLIGADGKSAGTVNITDAPRGVILRVEATGLTPGWHAIHLHEKGACTAPAFKDAGGHIHTVTPVVHGLLNRDANDDGDLPNIFAGKDGTATAEFYSDKVSLNGTDEKPVLLDADGSSVVIHEHPDDYKSQPIGGAGGRVACGVIR